MPSLSRLAWLFVTTTIIVTTAVPAAAGGLTDEQTKALVKWLATAPAERPAVDGLGLPDKLSRDDTAAVREEIWQAFGDGAEAGQSLKRIGELPPTMKQLKVNAKNGRVAIQARKMPAGEHTMPFTVIRRESKGVPEGGRSLFICTHGGGAHGKATGPHAWPVNTREWQVQTQLAIMAYPPEGIYFVPRMADDRLGRWWHKHNQSAFEDVIRHAIVHWGVDPNRVYLLGVSEGGFGTAILAPFMADRFAGANAMAGGVGLGNPPENLRNLAFRTDVGENDTMFNRVGLAKAFHQRLDTLHKADPKGYVHSINVQAGRGHAIDYRPGVQWIAKHTRNPYPESVIWISKQLHGQRRGRFYWLGLTGEKLTGVIRITATCQRDTNTVNITAEQLLIEGAGGYETHAREGKVTQTKPLAGATLTVLLNDEMLDLDKPVKITCNGKPAFTGRVKRSVATLLQTLADRGDPTTAYPVSVPIELR